MKRKISFLILLSILVIGCQQKESEDFLNKEEDCGCDDVDTTQVD